MKIYNSLSIDVEEWYEPLKHRNISGWKHDSDHLNKNIDVIPDILANSGGVLVSYFEWIQNKTNEYLDEDEINFKLEKKMNKTFNDVFNISKQYN